VREPGGYRTGGPVGDIVPKSGPQETPKLFSNPYFVPFPDSSHNRLWGHILLTPAQHRPPRARRRDCDRISHTSDPGPSLLPHGGAPHAPGGAPPWDAQDPPHTPPGHGSTPAWSPPWLRRLWPLPR